MILFTFTLEIIFLPNLWNNPMHKRLELGGLSFYRILPQYTLNLVPKLWPPRVSTVACRAWTCNGPSLTKMQTLVDEVIISWQREDIAAIFHPQCFRTPHTVITRLHDSSDIEGEMLWIEEKKLGELGCWIKTYLEMQSSQISLGFRFQFNSMKYFLNPWHI